MSAFRQFERDLAHISAMVALLRTHSLTNPKSPVMDPAYWRARIRDATRQVAMDRELQERVTNLIGQLDEISRSPRPASARQHAPWCRVQGKES